jgi:hypothetical protein
MLYAAFAAGFSPQLLRIAPRMSAGGDDRLRSMNFIGASHHDHCTPQVQFWPLSTRIHVES